MTRIGLLLVFLVGINLLTEARSTTDDIVTNLIQQNNNSRYCIVVGSFSSLNNARIFGNSVKSKGYEAAYRKNENGFYRVCLFDFATEQEAKAKIDEMKPKDALFKQVWVLGFNPSENVTELTETVAETMQKSSVAAKPKSEPLQTKKTIVPPTENQNGSKSATVEAKPKQQTTQTPKTISSSASALKQTVPKTEKVNVPPVKDEKQYARYSLAINRHATADAAKEYALSLQSNGYSVFLRKEEGGSYLVCMYAMDSKTDAEKRLDKMRHIDGIFTNAWILGYDDPASNLSINQP